MNTKPPFDGMADSMWRAIGKLRGDVRDRVLERSCILHAEGVAKSWEEADRMAFDMETRR